MVTGVTGAGLVLANGADTINVAKDGAFAFATKLASGASYAVSISTTPPGQTCTVANGAGRIASADVTNVAITCAARPSELFIADTTGLVAVFDASASGDVAPKRTIEGVLTKLSQPSGLFVTETELFVADGSGAILVFDRDASGDATPLRTIAGTNTNLKFPSSVFVDQGELFVADESFVLKVWNVNDNGNVAAKRYLAGDATGLAAIESAVVDDGELYVSSSHDGTVVVFPRGASGNVAPTRVLNGFPTDGPTGLLIDDTNLIVSNTKARIDIVDKHSGIALRSIAGASTGMQSMNQCTLLMSAGTILCASYDAGAVLGYPLLGTGDVPPSLEIAGPITTLASPRGVFWTGQ